MTIIYYTKTNLIKEKKPLNGFYILLNTICL
uniref:Uncharacterized protein n=1 Tax=Siphoviridae sp. ctiOl67 TaxID=2825622 RepID=A0A8S5QIS8_9CAUD|nr:MAG TPA: hypothetical protein [Siphoviridae sp. ctiOl67]